MKVLVACEYSGAVRDAFRALGHDAMSADMLPTETPGPHYEGDVLDLIGEPFDLVIAHPPCTYLANSGVRWLHEREGRWEAMREGAAFFAQMFQFNTPRLCVENPIQHGYAREAHGQGRPTQTIQPWQFGHGEDQGNLLMAPRTAASRGDLSGARARPAACEPPARPTPMEGTLQDVPRHRRRYGGPVGRPVSRPRPCTWCGHPPHPAHDCPATITVAEAHGGARLPRRWGEKNTTSRCPCARQTEDP